MENSNPMPIQSKFKANKLISKKVRMSKCQQIEQKFKSVDWFGQTMQLTYKGSEKYKTNLGAIMSYILIFILFSYILVRAIIMFNKLYPEIYSNIQVKDLNTYGALQPHHHGFYFSFRASESEISSSIGHFTVKEIEEKVVNTTSTGTPIKERTVSKEFEIETCEFEHFKFEEADMKSFGIQDSLCIIDHDYEIQGATNTEMFRFLELKLWKCQNSTENNHSCEDLDVIDEFMERQQLSFHFLNSFFEKDNFDDKYKFYIDDSISFDLESDRVKKAELFLMMSLLELQDDLIQFGQREHEHFPQVFTIKQSEDKYNETEGYIASVVIRLDKKFEIYERKVYSILELLENLGGLQEALFHIGVLFVGFFCQRLFHTHIMQQLYQVRRHALDGNGQENDEDAEKTGKKDFSQARKRRQSISKIYSNDLERNLTQMGKEHKSKGSSKSTNKNSGMDHFCNDSQVNTSQRELINLQVKNGGASKNKHVQGEQQPSQKSLFQQQRAKPYEEDEQDQDKSVKQRDHEMSIYFKDKKYVNKLDVSNLLVSFLQRQRFNYNMKMVYEYLLKCLCFRNINKKRYDPEYKRHFMFFKARQRLEEELDVIQVIKTLKKFKLLNQALLSQKHRMLLRFQRQNIIESSTSSSDSDHNNYDALTLMENENPLVKLLIFAKLKKMMNDFDGTKLKTLDRNLMRGIFQRKNKDFQESIKAVTENQSLLQRLTGGMLRQIETIKTPQKQKVSCGEVSKDVSGISEEQQNGLLKVTSDLKDEQEESVVASKVNFGRKQPRVASSSSSSSSSEDQSVSDASHQESDASSFQVKHPIKAVPKPLQPKKQHQQKRKSQQQTLYQSQSYNE